MLFKSLLLCAAAVSGIVSAQSDTLKTTFTFRSVEAGKTQKITYSAADLSSPVTIILRKGLSTNLGTVSTITTSATGGSFDWTPPTSLPDGSDYAIELKQGAEHNFSQQFGLTGGSASATITGTASVSSAVSSILSSLSSALNGTFANATTALTGTASVGTGSPISRNTTFSKPTLTKAASTTTSTSEASATSDSSSPSSTKKSGAAMVRAEVASPLALILTAVVAMIYLQ